MEQNSRMERLVEFKEVYGIYPYASVTEKQRQVMKLTKVYYVYMQQVE